jgi:class 3 adenylate cyclase
LPARVSGVFLQARDLAMLDRVLELDGFTDRSFKEVCQTLLPGTDPVRSPTPLTRQLGRQFEFASDLVDFQKTRERERDPSLPPLIEADTELLPMPTFLAAAKQSGFIDYLPLRDGVVRTVPLWENHRGRLLPQAAFVLACQMLDVDPLDPRQVQLEPDRIIVNAPNAANGPIVIPVFNQLTQRGPRGMFMAIPWFGGPEWESMYGVDERGQQRQHISIAAIGDVINFETWFQGESKALDTRLAHVLKDLAALPTTAASVISDPPPPTDLDRRGKLLELALQKARPRYEALVGVPASDRTAAAASMIDDYQTLQNLRDRIGEIDLRRRELQRELQNKAVLIGLIAGGLTDMVPTSLHARCPGVVIHGTIFNAIMTRRFWRPVSDATNVVIILAIGLIVSLLAAFLPPWPALFCTVATAAVYATANGFVLFNGFHLVVSLAAPLGAAALAWASGTLFRFLRERSERNRIESRFRGYIDPTLVDYVVRNPEQVILTGEKRELTVCFSDLEGFTRLSEKLDERIVPVLNKYMSTMVPVIREHRGFVAKLRGDGIMFFFGAPEQNPNHAADAVATALDMQRAMQKFNAYLIDNHLAPCATRIGIGTGPVTVGDAGSLAEPHRASDYTCLGDTVNLSARLESANKATGTSILVTERTVQVIGPDSILFRPIGRLRVVGKASAVMVYEPLGFVREVSDDQRRLAELSGQIVDAFRAGRFDDCLGALGRLNGLATTDKFRHFYECACRQRMAAPLEDFDGSITLETK